MSTNETEATDSDLNCMKCGKRSFTRPSPNRWCRTCKYENFEEYFGEGGVNDQKILERMKAAPEEFVDARELLDAIEANDEAKITKLLGDWKSGS
jgi:hypothetical protein